MLDQGLFQVGFVNMFIWRQVKKFQNVGIFDDLLIFPFWHSRLYLSRNTFLISAGKDAVLIHRVDLPLQLPHTPPGSHSFFRIKFSCFFILNTH